jgi:putative redox protein
MAQITAKLTSGTVVHLSNGRHQWKADEPPAVHGTDTGPNPYELLLGALAACTCITLSLYCRHKGLALESVSTTYDLARIHAKDCEDCDDPTIGFIDKITSNVHITGDFDEAQRKRLSEVSERCPVHKTLANGVVFSDSASFG